MPHPKAPFAARSPYDSGMSYFMDEYTGDGGYGDASRLSGTPNAAYRALGNLPPSSSTAVTSNDAAGTDNSTLQSAVNFAKQVWANWTAGAARDATREARAKLIMDFAIAGSVLGAQICLAGPDNVASNEDPYWTGAQAAIQQQRPDVWAEAVAAGKWWPVGEQFDMLVERRAMANALAGVGITVNQAAISQAFGTSDIPFQVTVAPGTVAPPTPGGGGTSTGAPVAGGGTTTTNPLLSGPSSPIMLLGLVGAAIYVATRKSRATGA